MDQGGPGWTTVDQGGLADGPGWLRGGLGCTRVVQLERVIVQGGIAWSGVASRTTVDQGARLGAVLRVLCPRGDLGS